MIVLQTDRLVLRHLSLDDAPFILDLLNGEAFLRFVGDKGVGTLEDARSYIARGPMESYAEHGFGLYLMALKDGGLPIGICGLLKRASLQDVDLGYAVLPRFGGQGYAVEAASAVVDYGRRALGIERIVAVTLPENHRSIKVLEKVGLRFEKTVRLSEGGRLCSLYATTFPGPASPDAQDK